MKCILNKIPVNTTNSFHVNSLEIDLELPKDLSYRKFSSKNTDEIDVKYSEIDDFKSNGLTFNKALHLDITISSKIDEPIEFIYDFDDDNNLIDNININFLEDSSANIIFKYVSNGNKNFHCLKNNITLSKYANANISIINLLSNDSTSIIENISNLDEHSVLNNNLFDIGGNIKISNYSSNVSNYASSYLNSLYIGKDKDIVDMNYHYKNVGINSNTSIDSYGVLDNKAIKTFRSTIDFISGCTKSNGSEKEECMLLSDECISRSVPLLLCGEEDVMGSHSVSSGKIDENKLFYLMSRGLSVEDSKKLIILATFNKVISKLDNKYLEEEIVEIINNKC